MKEDDMIRIQIEAGCPSGSSNHDVIGFWNKTSMIEVHHLLVRDFIDNLMEYARQEAQADHWSYAYWYQEEE